ncbi:DDE-type integrase/transposase/recombinase [Aminobacter anthyllidis]|uniref:DDE-type integrase/transposase/recombinase n=1 Tax=Aminobacter anthyllidis TaxID=1035067 RepID=A0A9X1D2L1_9HYPH|nr:DDE-type integrase/transposase/recombinase [Aminobacter anthyllidis]
MAWYARLGARGERVMTDNGSAYRSKLFAQALQGAGARHIRTRPYAPPHQRQGRALHPDFAA